MDSYLLTCLVHIPYTKTAEQVGQQGEAAGPAFPRLTAQPFHMAAQSCRSHSASSAHSEGTARCSQRSSPRSTPGHPSTNSTDERENSSLANSRFLSELWCLAAGRGSVVLAVLHVPSRLGSRACPSEGYSSSSDKGC